MRLLKNFLTFLTRSRARKANVTDAREQVIADVTNHDAPLSRSQSSEKVSVNVQRRVSSRQSGGADSSRPSIALSIPEMIEKTRLMAQSIDEQSDAERPSKRAEITRTITSGRYRYKDAQVYGYNDVVEQLRLDRLRRLQDLYKQEIRQGDGRQGEPKTAESKKDMLTATTVKGTRRLDIRSPNMCAESPRLTTFGTWAQLRQQQLQKLQQKQQQQQKHGQGRQHDRVIAIGEPMKKRVTKKTVRVSSNGITTEEAVTACGSPLAHDPNSMEVDTEPISRAIQAVDRGKSFAGHASNPNKKDMGAAQSRIPYLLRRELEEASRRIEQVEASVALEWQEKFEDLSQAAIALSAFIMPTSPKASVAVNSVRVTTGRYDHNYNDYKTRDNEFATTVLEVDADLSSLFHWNTKQLFIYAVAEYSTKTHPKNQLVIWDSIIRDPRDAILTKKRITNKYGVIDVNRKWTDITANVTLHWNIIPYVGFMTYGRAPVSDSITFPLPRTQ
ncbi:hypothetical protein DFQ26_003939 [Actinomortierella ambigua]|nr:hypothetical protein DFQ26_003939 [Actinomortierella ambigua]